MARENCAERQMGWRRPQHTGASCCSNHRSLRTMHTITHHSPSKIPRDVSSKFHRASLLVTHPARHIRRLIWPQFILTKRPWSDPVRRGCDYSERSRSRCRVWLVAASANWVASRHAHCHSVQIKLHVHVLYRNLSSHVDLHTHAGSAFHKRVILTIARVTACQGPHSNKKTTWAINTN